jgi:hypothetical protein
MLTRTDPFRELDRFAQQLLGAQGTWSRPSAMPMDAYREGDRYVVAFDLPGVTPDAIDIHVERNTLTVKAERRPAQRAAAGGRPHQATFALFTISRRRSWAVCLFRQMMYRRIMLPCSYKVCLAADSWCRPPAFVVTAGEPAAPTSTGADHHRAPDQQAQGLARHRLPV